MNDRRGADWPELLKALYAIPKTFHQRHRSDFVCRGVADQEWKLETSLKRLGGNYINVERPLLRSFRKYTEPGSTPDGTLWVRLAVAQHHGLPTRLLDWTVSPKVAVHFATAEEDHYDKDGAIWCLNIVKVRSLLPKALRDILENEYAFLFFEPPSLDARIVNQGAIMSVMPGATLVLSEFLEHHPDIYWRIIIPKELKWEVRDKLDQD